MSNNLEKILEKDKKRYSFLKALYDLSDGETDRPTGAYEIAEETSLSEQDLRSAFEYLEREALVKNWGGYFSLSSSAVSITHTGILEVEESVKNPNKDTEHFPVAVFQQFFIEQVDHITNNPGGISQNVTSSNVYGSLQAAKGNNNKQVAESNTAQPLDEKQLTQADVITVLVELEQILHHIELSAGIKEEATLYLGAARKAAEKEEPKKELAASNLKAFAETLENASKGTESAKKIWENVKPILERLPVWLGVAATFFRS